MSSLLTRAQLVEMVEGTGWRFLLGEFVTAVPVGGLNEAVRVAGIAVAACGDAADEHLRADVRPERVELTLGERGAPRQHDETSSWPMRWSTP